jgi:hypothetical protein
MRRMAAQSATKVAPTSAIKQKQTLKFYSLMKLTRPGLFLKTRIHAIIGMSALFTLWLLGHPYSGLYHDAWLYAVQALYRLHPHIFENDLFFHYGSQDQYTIFSLLYAQAITLFGLDWAVLFLTFAGQLLWFAGTAFLLSSLSSGFVYWLALLLITVLPGYYGPEYMLSYGEPFLTPRLYAEAVALMGVGFAVKGRWRLAGILVFFALALHPIVTLPVLFFLIIYHGPVQNKWLKTGAVILAAVILIAVLTIEPFNRLLQTMDSQWYQLTLRRSSFLEFTAWRTADWMPIIFSESVLFTSWLAAEGKLKKIFFAVIATSIIGIALNIMGVTLLKNILLMQIQTWRWLWLLSWFTYFAFAWFAGAYWKRSEYARAVILVLICAWSMLEHAGVLIAPLAAGAWAWRVRRGYEQKLPRLVWMGVYMLLLQSAAWMALHIQFSFRMVEFFQGQETRGQTLFRLGSGIIIVPLFFVIWRFFKNSQTLWIPIFSAIVTGTAFFIVISEWNNRQPFNFPRQLSNVEEFAEFRRIIPENSIVYWEDNNAVNVWFLLERSSYISEIQTAGIVFNRQTALEALRRTENIRPLSMRDYAITMAWKGRGKPLAQPKVNKYDLIKACQDPLLDFVIFKTPIDGAIEVANDKDTQTGQRYYLYDCSIMRQG